MRTSDYTFFVTVAEKVPPFSLIFFVKVCRVKDVLPVQAKTIPARDIVRGSLRLAGF
jgi:hypothetical protein